MKHCILALDCGGTKCESVVLSDDGDVLGWGRSENRKPSSPEMPGGFGRSKEAVLESAAQALDGIRCGEIEVIGSTSMKLVLNHRETRSRFISEADAALALTGLENGLVVVAGTGSRVFGRTRDGREFELDGLGPMLGDYGSGYQIGLMALRAAARSSWNSQHQTSLGERVRMKLLGNAVVDDFGACFDTFSSYEANRSNIAWLAKVTAEEAVKGDVVALKILDDASSQLADTVYDVVSRLEMDTQEYHMAGTGSVITGSDLYWRMLCSKVHTFVPQLRPIISDLHPVVGYAVAALKSRYPSHYAEPVATLLKSARSYQRPTAS